jgi:hypothetical protein
MVVAGIVLACAAFIASGAVQGRRQVGIEAAAPAKEPTPVSVVGGTVDVGNLPLDADGNVRVAGAVAGPSYQWVHAVSAMTVSGGSQTLSDPIDVAGWRRAALLMISHQGRVQATIGFGGDGVFGETGERIDFQPIGFVFRTEVGGPQLRVGFYPDVDDTVDIWLYLSN